MGRNWQKLILLGTRCRHPHLHPKWVLSVTKCSSLICHAPITWPFPEKIKLHQHVCIHEPWLSAVNSTFCLCLKLLCTENQHFFILLSKCTAGKHQTVTHACPENMKYHYALHFICIFMHVSLPLLYFWYNAKNQLDGDCFCIKMLF